MRSLSMHDKDLLIALVRSHMEQWLESQPAEVRGPIGAYCVWWAFHLVSMLKEMDIPAQIQAGTAYWPRLRPEQDDGNSNTPTQFGYLFTPSRENMAQVVCSGTMPEMHAWVGIRGANGFPNTVIDPTTFWWPMACLKSTGMDWPGDYPPAYFWSDRLPRGVTYSPSREAIKLCYQILYLTDSLKG